MGFSDEVLGSQGQVAMQAKRAEIMQQMAQQQIPSTLGGLGNPFLGSSYRSTNTVTRNPEGTLTLIKKSIKEIKAEAVSGEAQGRIEAKIERLLDLGALAQATILDAELRVRQKLNHLQEWDYKVLPAEEIGRFESENRVTATQDGVKVHIDPLDTYCGAIPETEAKDKIIPDAVLDELEKAQERKLFDKFSVLWVEEVKDPLLLGSIDGCKDYFFITEWGEDISFDEIMKSEK